MCETPPPRIYPSLPEYTPFSTNLYVRPSQNRPLSLKIYPPPFSTNVYVRPTQNLPLPPKYTSPFNNYIQHSQNLSLSPRIYPHPSPLFNNYIIMLRSQNLFSPPIIYPLSNNYMRHSQKPPLPPSYFISATLSESTPPSQTIPLFSNNLCVQPPPPPPRIYPSLPEYTPFSTNLYVRPSQNRPLSLKIYPLPF